MRIPLERIIESYKDGETAEGLVESFDTLRLADVYAVISLSHNRKTMTKYARDRVRAGLPMPGVFIARRRPVGRMIDEILIVTLCSDPYEWKDRVEFLPF